MAMIEIDGKEISMIEFIEKKIRKIIRVCSANGSSIEGIDREDGFFYSEDEFQISLVREFEKYYNDFTVYYEKSYGKNRIDIVLEKGSNQYPIELKYSYDKYGTDKDLSDGFLDDINKINNIVKDFENSGYCILLIKNTKNLDEDMKGKLAKLVIKKETLTLSGPVQWKETIEKKVEIEELPIARYDTIENFHYLIIEISKQSAEKIISK